MCKSDIDNLVRNRIAEMYNNLNEITSEKHIGEGIQHFANSGLCIESEVVAIDYICRLFNISESSIYKVGVLATAIIESPECKSCEVLALAKDFTIPENILLGVLISLYKRANYKAS